MISSLYWFWLSFRSLGGDCWICFLNVRLCLNNYRILRFSNSSWEVMDLMSHKGRKGGGSCLLRSLRVSDLRSWEKENWLFGLLFWLALRIEEADFLTGVKNCLGQVRGQVRGLTGSLVESRSFTLSAIFSYSWLILFWSFSLILSKSSKVSWSRSWWLIDSWKAGVAGSNFTRLEGLCSV